MNRPARLQEIRHLYEDAGCTPDQVAIQSTLAYEHELDAISRQKTHEDAV